MPGTHLHMYVLMTTYETHISMDRDWARRYTLKHKAILSNFHSKFEDLALKSLRKSLN